MFIEYFPMLVLANQGHCHLSTPSGPMLCWTFLHSFTSSVSGPVQPSVPQAHPGLHFLFPFWVFFNLLPTCPGQGSTRCPKELRDFYLQGHPEAPWPGRAQVPSINNTWPGPEHHSGDFDQGNIDEPSPKDINLF